MSSDLAKIKAIEASNKKRILKVNEDVNDESGIYFLTRINEEGFKFIYIGQSKHLLTRLAQHLSGYQHIDLSIKKHGFYSENNPYGWNINFINFDIEQLDSKEQYYIKLYANKGYQLRNKTSGSQGEGKKKIAEYKPAKGYYDGVEYGKKTLAKQLKDIIEKHLNVEIKEEKKNNKISIKQFEKFKEILKL